VIRASQTGERYRDGMILAVVAGLLERAQAGDEAAFGELIAPYRRELQVHCYRMLGSLQEAEDALQDTLLAAWQDLPRFEQRSTLRTWLYQVATRRCLNALRSARRRPQADWPPPGVSPPEPSRLGEVLWLEPYPDAFLEGLPDSTAGPEARYEAREAISLAFITAVQLLAPRQRAVLILRDVLGFPARDVARMLDSTEESVTSALKRARATMQHRPPATRELPPPARSAAEQELVAQLTRAYEMADIGALVTLLTDDVLLTMPPAPLEYAGRELVAQFLTAVVFEPGLSFRMIPARANGQPAFSVYTRPPSAATFEPTGVLVFTLAGAKVSAITRFGASALRWFDLPASLPA
jgi:RNA polymerase sigma-70 factor (TIGR02960 family)